MNADPGTGRGILWIKWVVLAQMAYWAVFSLVVPTMNWDSQTYNLSRLLVARQHGLFGNTGWSTARQVFFPWTFDAIHYPLLFVLRGQCLPSYACFAGLLIIVYRLVAPVRSPRQAWWCCLALMALPTLLFQAICTKNDVAVVFALACWFYAWRLWQEERLDRYVVYMTLALCFAAGVKTTGLPYLGVLGAYTLWHLRDRRPQVLRFVACGAVFLVLLGSVEIYVNNWLLYHAPLGPKGIIDSNVNKDGLPGGIATFVRWCFSNMSIGLDAANHQTPVCGWLENACRECLRVMGLLHDVGYRAGTGEGDANMHFLKLGFDAGSDYGPVGAWALLAGLVFVFARPWSDPVWKLAAGGLATLALTSYTLAWLAWDARFLVLTFTLLTLALSLAVLSLPDRGPGRFVRVFFQFLVVYSSVAYPLFSVAKKPGDLLLAIQHRPEYELIERPTMLPVVRDLRQRAPVIGASPVLLLAGDDSWTLCILEMRGLRVQAVGAVDQPTLAAAARTASGASQPVYVLALNHPLPPETVAVLTKVSDYTEVNSGLYEWQPPRQGH